MNTPGEKKVEVVLGTDGWIYHDHLRARVTLGSQPASKFAPPRAGSRLTQKELRGLGRPYDVCLRMTFATWTAQKWLAKWFAKV